MKKVELGDEVKCKVTGFKGVVTMYSQCLTGCDRIVVQPPVNKEGKHPDSMWLDTHAVTIIKKGKVKPESVREPIELGGRKGGPPAKYVRGGR
jgi:hypothetical protein